MTMTIGSDHIIADSGSGKGVRIINPGGASLETNHDANPYSGAFEITFPIGPSDVPNTDSNDGFEYKMKISMIGQSKFNVNATVEVVLQGRITGGSNGVHHNVRGQITYWSSSANAIIDGYSWVDSTTGLAKLQFGRVGTTLWGTRYDFEYFRVDEISFTTDSGVTIDDVKDGWDISVRTTDITNSYYWNASSYRADTPAITNVKHHSWDTYQMISSSTTGGYYKCTDSEFTYTPVGTGKLIVVCSPMVYTTNYYGGVALFKDGSIINASSAGGSRNIVHAHVPHEIYSNSSQPFIVEIDHNSTSPITFDLRTQNRNYSVNWVWNRAGYHSGDPNAVYNVSAVSTITVYEVSS